MDMNTEVVTDYLIRISAGKLQLVNQLLQLTLQQQEALGVVAEEGISALDRHIHKKQEIMGKIDLLDKEFLEKFQILKDQLGISSFADLTEEPVEGIKELQKQIKEILKVTGKIKEIDEANAIKAQQNLEEIKQQIKVVKIGKKTNQGYGKKFNEIHSILIDKKN